MTRISFNHLLYSLVTDANGNAQLFQLYRKGGFEASYCRDGEDRPALDMLVGLNHLTMYICLITLHGTP